MEGASVVPYSPRTLEQVFKDFKNRRAGMLRALTVDVEDFCRECDPEKENLCLYGFPDGSWKVSLPADEVPPELPEPALGINFARDGMLRKDWLSLVAVHSDAWLIAVAFYYGARFDKNDRKNLFDMMNALPTIYDVVTGRKTVQDKTNGSNGGNKSKPSSKVKSSFTQKQSSRPAPSYEEEDETPDEEDEEDHEDTFCGSCGLPYNSSEFWIGCDICEKWFHGKCVKITPARAEHIKQYKCPSCTNKRARV